MKFLVKYRLNKISLILFMLYFATVVDLFISAALYGSIGTFPENIFAILVMAFVTGPFLWLIRLWSFFSNPNDKTLCILLTQYELLDWISVLIFLLCYIWLWKSWTRVAKIITFIISCIFLSQVFW